MKLQGRRGKLAALAALIAATVVVSACSSQGASPTGQSAGTAAPSSDSASHSSGSAAKSSGSDAQSSTPTANLPQITVSMLTDTTAMPVWLAQKLGYFKDNGISVKFAYAASGAAALPAGLSGDWQAGWIGSPPALTGWQKWGLISFPHIREAKNLKLWVRKDALKGKTPAELLKSAKIGTGANSTFENLLFQCAEHFGVSPSDLKIVPLDPPQVLQSLKANRIQMGTLSSSSDYVLDQDSKTYEMLCNGVTTGGQFITMYDVTPTFVQEHPQEAAAYVDAVYRANEYVDANPAKAAEYMTEFGKTVGLDINHGDAVYNVKNREWLTLDQAIQAAKDGTTQKTLESLSDFFVKVGVYTEKPDVKKLEDAALKVLESAKAFRDKHR